jgi:hypothetical protein
MIDDLAALYPSTPLHIFGRSWPLEWPGPGVGPNVFILRPSAPWPTYIDRQDAGVKYVCRSLAQVWKPYRRNDEVALQQSYEILLYAALYQAGLDDPFRGTPEQVKLCAELQERTRKFYVAQSYTKRFSKYPWHGSCRVVLPGAESWPPEPPPTTEECLEAALRGYRWLLRHDIVINEWYGWPDRPEVAA